MPGWAVAIGAALLGVSWRRIAVMGVVALLGLGAAWLWHQASYVSRADYRALEAKYEDQRAVLAEREAAAEADAEIAEADTARLRQLEETVDALEAHGDSPGDDPVVWDRADIEWLRQLRR